MYCNFYLSRINVFREDIFMIKLCMQEGSARWPHVLFILDSTSNTFSDTSQDESDKPVEISGK